MGRYVLLEFDDNEKADLYVESLQARIADYPLAEPRPVAMFTKPAKLCECAEREEKSFRGQKFGWWCCPKCRRPKSRSGQNLNTIWPIPWRKKLWRMPLLHVQWKMDKHGRVVTIQDE